MSGNKQGKGIAVGNHHTTPQLILASGISLPYSRPTASRIPTHRTSLYPSPGDHENLRSTTLKPASSGSTTPSLHHK